MSSVTCDIAFVGGGLANTLAALRLAALRPELKLAVIEKEDSLGGEHTWSFHDTDLTAEQLEWTDGLIAYRWPSQEVQFPAYTRTLDIGYRSVTSSTLHTVATERLGGSLHLGTAVEHLGTDGVRLRDGRAIEARAVIDGRGVPRADTLTFAWQKFLGREIRTTEPHRLDAPVIMDATVPQTEGYRFVYLLPFCPDRLLVEDTYYTDGPELDGEALGQRIEQYVAQRGWQIAETIREERGVLPIALGGDIEAFWQAGDDQIARSGLAAALFHPTTGYSLPDAVRLADAFAGLPDFNGRALRQLTQQRSVATWKRRSGFRFLNRMLFRAARPGQQWRLLERFYRFPEGLISRFYADRLTVADRIRILSGRPPVPLGRALACLSDRH